MCFRFVALRVNKKFSHGRFLIFCSASLKLSNNVFDVMIEGRHETSKERQRWVLTYFSKSKAVFLAVSKDENSHVILIVLKQLFENKMCFRFVTLRVNKKFSHGRFLIFCSALLKLSNNVFDVMIEGRHETSKERQRWVFTYLSKSKSVSCCFIRWKFTCNFDGFELTFWK